MVFAPEEHDSPIQKEKHEEESGVEGEFLIVVKQERPA